ncbi:MAG: DUF2157 domain-containing protein [Thermoanaerobaculia bacterium]
MPLERQLKRWLAADLIDADQAQGIAAFEKERGRPLFLYAIAGLGGLAIAIGVVSIVASNWDAIPGQVKIGVDLALVIALGLAVVWLEEHGPAWAREVAIVVLYGLVMASIALVGQVYQLGGKAREAMAVWSVLTALLMTRARSGFAAFVWLAGLQITYFTWLVWLGEKSDDQMALALGAAYLAPIVSIAIGRSAWVQSVRPALARVFEAIGWAEIVFCASFGTFAFYEDTADEYWRWLGVGFVISAVLTGWLWTRIPDSRWGRPARWLLVTCLLLAYVPLVISPGNLDLVAALTFIGLWVLVAYTAHQAGLLSLLNLATAVIGIRILIVYFEVFGSLLGTGVGLVTGGMLTLGMVWLWVRKRREFARELTPEDSR